MTRVLSCLVCLLVASIARAQDGGVPDAASDGDAAVDAAPDVEDAATPDAIVEDASVEDAAPEVVDAESPPEEPPPEALDPEVEAALLDPNAFLLAPVEVRSTAIDVFRTGGSVQVVTEEELEALDYDDPHSVLAQQTGVYVRQEDGFGLRPNIGIRGANSERSRRITLMEDGVLFAPAPYAAPAAYYFPLITRMVGIEVWKGPSAILFGPHTVGGAVNFLSRPIPEEPTGRISLAAGAYGLGRAHAFLGASNEHFGVLVEALRWQSTGFKELDPSPSRGEDADTGFRRDEAVLKLMWRDDGDVVDQSLVLRGGFGFERSNETYTGLSDADFRDNPYRRYAGTALDLMRWHRTDVSLTYTLDFGDAQLVTTAYRSDLARVWRKLNRFRGADLETILDDPTGGTREVFYRVLTGAEDSAGDDEALMIGTNDRTFAAQGIQSELRAAFSTGEIGHQARVGARIHYDEVDRLQTEDAFLVRDGELVAEGTDRLVNTDEVASAVAFSAFVLDSIAIGELTLVPGLRIESIWTELDSRIDASSDASAVIFLPGMGAQYAISEEVGVLAGVHRGFSPVAPGQPSDVKPETSINFELGGRMRLADDDGTERTTAELIGFLSDYTNLTGDCSFASGCLDVDRQFNGGQVLTAGAESAVAHRFVAGDFEIPLRATYTFTWTRFGSGFRSDNPQFGNVEEGDALPYVPMHQGALNAGLERPDVFSVNVAATFVGEMREEASQGDDGRRTDAQLFVDIAGRWQLLPHIALLARAENVLFQDPIVSRRPFGARPARPFQVEVGVEAEL